MRASLSYAIARKELFPVLSMCRVFAQKANNGMGRICRERQYIERDQANIQIHRYPNIKVHKQWDEERRSKYTNTQVHKEWDGQD